MRDIFSPLSRTLARGDVARKARSYAIGSRAGAGKHIARKARSYDACPVIR